jgi:hypothetical protein
MRAVVAIVITGTFGLLALLHVFWAISGSRGTSAAIPEIDGRPAFVPSRALTLLVAALLALCALLVAASAGLVIASEPPRWVGWLAFGAALVPFARAIGDFRLVGFFKRVRGTRFAQLDSLVYSPLCLVLAAGVFYVANAHHA